MVRARGRHWAAKCASWTVAEGEQLALLSWPIPANVVDMSRTRAIEMTTERANFETLTEATLRVDEAERNVRVAALA